MEGVHHGFTEPHAVVAHWDANGRLQLYTPQQVPHHTHRALSTVLDVPMHQINVVRTFVGEDLVANQIHSLTRCVQQF